MPSYVIPDKCDGCKALDKTACQYICPNDLMVLNKDIMKAYNQDPQMCWECYSCVKICPNQAIEVRGYQDFVPMGASVTAMRSSEDIMWTVQFRDKEIRPKRFKFPIRRGVSEGQAAAVRPLAHRRRGHQEPDSDGRAGGHQHREGPGEIRQGSDPLTRGGLNQSRASARNPREIKEKWRISKL